MSQYDVPLEVLDVFRLVRTLRTEKARFYVTLVDLVSGERGFVLVTLVADCTNVGLQQRFFEHWKENKNVLLLVCS